MAIYHTRGISDRYLKEFEASSDGQLAAGVVRRVWETKFHVLVPDARTDPLLEYHREIVRLEGYVTLLTLPMLYGDAVLGTVGLYFDAQTVLTEEYIGTAQDIADHYAIALARKTGLAPSTAGRIAACLAGPFGDETSSE